MDARRLADQLRPVLGDDAIITDHQRLRTYECDGLTHHKVIPALVVLVETTAHVAAVVRACAAAGVPFVARGSGTGLSGGALPHADGVLIVMSRMREILEIDRANQRAVVEPGVINLQLTRAAQPQGYYYAPDPSSQQICSIGGNVAENSGGAHCLKYGFTTNHVTGLELVTPGGEVVQIGGKAVDAPGYDLLGAIVGSEGTLGIATKVTVRLTRTPEAVRTLLAAFPHTDQAGAAVSAIIGAGVIPAAIEMMDALAIEAAEAAVHCGYPGGAGAVLIVELDGPAAEVAHQFDEVEAFCRDNGAFEIRIEPMTPSGPCSGRVASPPSPRSGGSVPTTSSRTASSREQRFRRCCDASLRSQTKQACALPTSSTPATATCTRWCCSTPRCQASHTGPNKSPARSWICASSTAARSPVSTGSAPTRPSTCHECSAMTTSTRCSWCAVLLTHRRSPTRARSSSPHACAVRSLAGTRAPIH